MKRYRNCYNYCYVNMIMLTFAFVVLIVSSSMKYLPNVQISIMIISSYTYFE